MAVGEEVRTRGLAYDEVLRAGRPGWWRPAVGIVSLGAGAYILAPILVQIPFLAWFSIGGGSVEDQFDRLVDTDQLTPSGLAYVNLVLAMAIPVTWLLVRFLHGLPPRWLASIGPRIRWRWLLVCLGISLVALVVTVLLSALLPAESVDGSEPIGGLNAWSSTMFDFVVVILLLTPLQAAAEEYAFRGYLLQALGGIVRARWVAVVFSALLFGLAHGLGQSVPVFFDRFAFGLVAGALVTLTGGLEAGIAMHVLNNFLAYGFALAFGDMATVLDPPDGTWWSIPVTVVRSLVYLGLVVLIARRIGLRTVSEPGVLVAPRGRV